MTSSSSHVVRGTDLSHIDFVEPLLLLEDGVIVTDASGRILVYNRAQAFLDQLDPDNVLNRSVSEIYHLSESNSLLLSCLRTGQPIHGQATSYRLSDPDRVCRAVCSVFPLKSGREIKGAICFTRSNHKPESIDLDRPASKEVPPSGGFRNRTRFSFSDIIGSSPEFLACLRRARAAALTKSMVLICGETGTGKEMLAQAIHSYSQRRHHPFVAVNCAAIPESLQESTLFGTSRGAFTGALERQGLFEEAMGGTLYLDEVDSMPHALQAKLLRILQDMKVRRVGSSAEKALDVRIISSVKKEYQRALPMDAFRKDFYYRLSVVLIEIPPLRTRRGDLELLTNHFIAKNNLLLEMQVESASAEVMELFRHYEWPGNVRELEHVVEGAMNAMGRDTELRMDHLPSNFAVSGSADGGSASEEVYTFFPLGDRDRLLQGLDRLKEPDSDAAFEGSVNLTKAQNRREAELLHQAIKEAGGNISQAARQLGVSRQLLHYKLKKFGILPRKLRK